MSLIRTFITSCVVLGGLGAAGYYILNSAEADRDEPAQPRSISPLPTQEDEECLSDDCWVYRTHQLHCASAADARRHAQGDLENARCRQEAYICVVKDCATEREIRNSDEFTATVDQIGDRTWRNWEGRMSSHRGARVRVTLTEEGELRGTEILRSSGSSTFDSQALAAIERSAPYHEIRQMAPEMRVLLTRINLSFGGVAAASATEGEP
ncbi:TonB family protein [Halomonas sp. C05BenzN]|jgi:TonB family protein|uniref:TonB family protein n=1 Tax=Halomonas sp. C05BenzN TaxID=3411041 RepID=UPI003B94F5E5